jgi:L-fucose isomerase-like protein
MSEPLTLGVVVGNRGFFPNHLAEQGRVEMLGALAKAGFRTVCLTPEDTPFGTVETRPQARACAELFKKEGIDGIVVTLPNFGDERGVAEALRLTGRDVPVLIQATPDDPRDMTIANRRDGFCGKLSVCNNLTQYGIPFSLTTLHTSAPDSKSFQNDLQWFGATCRVVRGVKHARIGALGARPAAFNTVRYSEKLLENSGIAVETLDLGDALGRVTRLADDAVAVQAKIESIKAYVEAAGVPAASLVKMAKLGVVIDEWMESAELDATAIQCWTALEEFFGVVPCTIMSMLSNKLTPSACEVDVTGAVGMLALALASGEPAALLDWNNNYGDDPDKCVLFHCSNLPTGCLSCAKMGTQAILGGTVGLENTWGTVEGRMKSGPFTFCRVSTNDFEGTIDAYVGEGEFTDDPLETFGGTGVARIPDLQGLLRHLCESGFEHHVAATHARVAHALDEAFGTYLGWDVYRHN